MKVPMLWILVVGMLTLALGSAMMMAKGKKRHGVAVASKRPASRTYGNRPYRRSGTASVCTGCDGLHAHLHGSHDQQPTAADDIDPYATPMVERFTPPPSPSVHSSSFHTLYLPY